MGVVVILEEFAEEVRVERIRAEGIGGAGKVKRISDRKSAANDRVLALLTEIFEEDVATDGVAASIEGRIGSECVDVLHGLMKIGGPTGAISTWGGELETHKTAVDQDDRLKASGVGSNHRVAHVGALRTARKSRRDDENWTVGFQLRDVPIQRNIASIGCLQAFAMSGNGSEGRKGG